MKFLNIAKNIQFPNMVSIFKSSKNTKNKLAYMDMNKINVHFYYADIPVVVYADNVRDTGFVPTTDLTFDKKDVLKNFLSIENFFLEFFLRFERCG